ncbi:MAG: type ISP restriction/modification enzyme, partial [Candidatus Hermodarchaeota archaeon]
LREEKYDFLSKNDISSIQWTRINPASPFYFFFPIDLELQHEYEKGMQITKIMPVNTVGIVTARDQLTIQTTPEEVWEVVQDFSSLPVEQARVKYNLGKDTIEWKVEFAQKDLIGSGLKSDFIVPILYRPFDIRYTYYTGKSKGFICRPRPDLMNHMIKDNLALCVGRAGQVVGIDKLWNLVFCSKYVIDLNIFYRGGSSNFPLYIYQNGHSNQERIPNFSKEFLERLQSKLGSIPRPKDIFFYIYAILHSPTYRRRYKEFLRVNYPRIPLTSKLRLFESLSELGCELVLLHTMESPKQENTVIYLRGEGDNVVETIRKISFKNERLKINKSQFFEKINEKVYNYHTGGYQLIKKWLKDRKGNELTEQEVVNLNKMIISISKSLEIMDEIDKRIEELGEGWPIAES